MKLHIKIADDGFAPKFNKGDIVVIDTRAEAKSDGVCLAREKKNKQYMLCENKGYSFYNGVKNEKKADAVVIGWAIEVIKKL